MKFAGAAGRLSRAAGPKSKRAGDEGMGTGTATDGRRGAVFVDSATRVSSGEDPAVPADPADPAERRALEKLERAFHEKTSGVGKTQTEARFEGSPSVAGAAFFPDAPALDLAASLGGLDLDGLLSRLSDRGRGEALAAEVSSRRRETGDALASGDDDPVTSGEDDDDHGKPHEKSPRRFPDPSASASRRAEGSGNFDSERELDRGRGFLGTRGTTHAHAARNPTSIANRERTTDAWPVKPLDPYGRGTRRTRRAAGSSVGEVRSPGTPSPSPSPLKS